MSLNASTHNRPDRICDSVMDAVGYTPAIRLSRLFSDHPGAEVIAKLEYMNPSGSIKDRMVRYMLQRAEESGQLKSKQAVESSSGNTGAALAMACAVKKVNCDIFVPDKTSKEKLQRIRAYGANVHVCPSGLPFDHTGSYYLAARNLAAEVDAFYLDQYCSDLNRMAHYENTAPEIWTQMNGEIDYFVCGIGSGGTISGIGRYLKERNPAIKVIGVEPEGSCYQGDLRRVNSNREFSTVIEGVGKPKPAESFDPSVVDDVVQVSDTLSLEYCRRLANEEGVLAGGSSGTVVAGIATLLGQIKDGRFVTIFPDSGAFYLSKYF